MPLKRMLTHTLITGQILQKLHFTNTVVLMGGVNSTYSQWKISKRRTAESQRVCFCKLICSWRIEGNVQQGWLHLIAIGLEPWKNCKILSNPVGLITV